MCFKLESIFRCKPSSLWLVFLVQVLHNCSTCRCPCVTVRHVSLLLSSSFVLSTTLTILSSSLLKQADREILRRVADQFKLCQYELNLLNQLTGTR